jgi:hypothetical protein
MNTVRLEKGGVEPFVWLPRWYKSRGCWWDERWQDQGRAAAAAALQCAAMPLHLVAIQA